MANCSRCRKRGRRANHVWCRECGTAYSREKRAAERALGEESDADRQSRRDRIAAYIWKAGDLLAVKRGPEGGQRRDLTPQIGKALFMARCEVSALRQSGAWKDELEFLALSYGAAKYYIDAFHRYNATLKEGDVPL